MCVYNVERNREKEERSMYKSRFMKRRVCRRLVCAHGLRETKLGASFILLFDAVKNEKERGTVST